MSSDTRNEQSDKRLAVSARILFNFMILITTRDGDGQDCGLQQDLYSMSKASSFERQTIPDLFVPLCLLCQDFEVM